MKNVLQRHRSLPARPGHRREHRNVFSNSRGRRRPSGLHSIQMKRPLKHCGPKLQSKKGLSRRLVANIARPTAAGGLEESGTVLAARIASPENLIWC